MRVAPAQRSSAHSQAVASAPLGLQSSLRADLVHNLRLTVRLAPLCLVCAAFVGAGLVGAEQLMHGQSVPWTFAILQSCALASFSVCLHCSSWMRLAMSTVANLRLAAVGALVGLATIPLLLATIPGMSLAVHMWLGLHAILACYYLSQFIGLVRAVTDASWRQSVLIGAPLAFCGTLGLAVSSAFFVSAAFLRKSPWHVEFLAAGVGYPTFVALGGRVVLVEMLTTVLAAASPSICKELLERFAVRTSRYAFSLPPLTVLLLLHSRGSFLFGALTSIVLEGLGVAAALKSRAWLLHRRRQKGNSEASVQASATVVPAPPVGSALVKQQRDESTPAKSHSVVSLANCVSTIRGRSMDSLAELYAQEEIAEKVVIVVACCSAAFFNSLRGDEKLAWQELALRSAVLVVAEVGEDLLKKQIVWHIGGASISSFHIPVGVVDIVESGPCLLCFSLLLFAAHIIANLLQH